ncbi:MAG: class I SAM-dependent methyltransferase [Vicinamibacterales bacterium]
MTRRCHGCRGDQFSPVLDFGEQPISHRLLNTPDEAEYVHPLALRRCQTCGLIQIEDPIPPAELYSDYNWLSTWKPQHHVPELVQWVVTQSGLPRDALVIEAGSNDGLFLSSLRDQGFTNLLGLEPARDAREAALAKGIRTLPGYLTPDVARQLVADHGKCRLFISRHVLEHVPDLPAFGEAMSLLLEPGGFVLIEVPFFQRNLESNDYSLIWEEHANYFTEATLNRFMAAHGVRVFRRAEFIFSGEAIALFGERAGDGAAVPAAPAVDPGELVEVYRRNFERFRAGCIAHFERCRAEGRPVIVYGAGVRAHAMLNFARLASYVDFIVDDQPEKQGKFFPGARLPIKPSSALDSAGRALCLLAVNAENETTVIAKHQAFLDRGGEFYSVCPPSHRLLPVWQGLERPVIR